MMRFQTPLVPATLIRRYKRFLADIRFDDGAEAVAHCANPGAMTGLAEPGTRIWVEPNSDPRKKLRYGWRLVDHGGGHFTGVDTGLPNRALKAALTAGDIPELAGYAQILPERKYGRESRIDFLLRDAARPDAYVEVKSVTLCRTPELAEFPDTVTARGARHLRELADMARAGHRAVLFYLVQRTDCRAVQVAADIDPDYAAACAEAIEAGVDMLAYATRITPENIAIGQKILFRPGRPSGPDAHFGLNDAPNATDSSYSRE